MACTSVNAKQIQVLRDLFHVFSPNFSVDCLTRQELGFLIRSVALRIILVTPTMWKLREEIPKFWPMLYIWSTYWPVIPPFFWFQPSRPPHCSSTPTCHHQQALLEGSFFTQHISEQTPGHSPASDVRMTGGQSTGLTLCLTFGLLLVLLIGLLCSTKSLSSTFSSSHRSQGLEMKI